MPLAILLASLSLLPSEDFLVGRPSTPATLTKGAADGTLLLSNGLVSRRFVTTPNFATVSLRSEVSFDTGGVVEALRGVGPEARITLSCGAGHRRGLLAYAAGTSTTCSTHARPLPPLRSHTLSLRHPPQSTSSATLLCRRA